MILAGDLGGTKSNLGLFEARRGKLRRVAQAKFPSHEYDRAEEIVRAFLRQTKGRITAACFAVAGPVVNNTVHATNLPWLVNGASLAKLLRIRRAILLNDLEATARGLSALEPADFETLHEGMALPHATQIVIAAGTGLGEAILFWDGKRHLPVATEGGHADFAPHGSLQVELLKHLQEKYGSVSWEHILSGRGFHEIHEFLDRRVTHPGFEDPHVDPAPEITRRALEKSCDICVQTLDLWVDVYGAEAGNFALKALARGGVFVAGGIAVKILPKVRDGRFAAALAEKSKFRSFLTQIPIYIVLNEDAPLLGAALAASERGGLRN